LISVADGSSVVLADLAAPFGDGYLTRDQSGRLSRVRKGKRASLASSDCGAKVVHSDPDRQRVLIGCAGRKQEKGGKRARRRPPQAPVTRWPLRLVGPGVDRDLKLTLGPTGNDAWPPPFGTSLAAVHAGAQTLLVDTERDSIMQLSAGDMVVHVHRRRALVLNATSLRLLEPPSLKPLLKTLGVKPVPQFHVAGPMAFVSPLVIDLERARVVGRVERTVLALAKDGRVLVADGGDPEPGRLARGPLAWQVPTPVP
jgi:hypothetical protein